MDHYVAYHSIERMGHDYQPGDHFSYESRKSEKALRAALGSTTWLVVGRRESRRTVYQLVGKYYPSRVRAAADGSLIEGWGAPLRPPREVTGATWFQTLVREQSNFSFGFNRVRDANVIAGLESLAPAAQEISSELLRSSAEDERDDDAFISGT